VIAGTDGDGVDDVSERNVFGGGTYGIYVNGNRENVVAGNYFGFAADGVSPLGIQVGLHIRQSSTENLVGSNQDGISDRIERNHIGNCTHGVDLITSSDGVANDIVGNWIGLNVNGSDAANSIGIRVSAFSEDRQSDHLVSRNRIQNNGIGIRVSLDTGLSAHSLDNCIESSPLRRAGLKRGVRHATQG
jgi:hypothetical protein